MRAWPEDLTWRAMALGAAGAAVIGASSTYVALRLGALPWPTIFVAVLSLAVLRPLGASLREVNVAHTGMSAGGLVAGGVAFTLPGLWMAHPDAAFPLGSALTVAVSGALFGVVSTWQIRRSFIEERDLPFPMGTAAAETLRTGEARGGRLSALLASVGGASLFTLCRDRWNLVPALVGNPGGLSIWLSPMAVGIGYLIGPLYTATWAAGALFAYALLLPLGATVGLFPDGDGALLVKNSLGIGVIVGAGVALLLQGIGSARRVWARTRSLSRRAGIGAAVATALLTLGSGMTLPTSLAATAGVWACVVMAATLTGQTGIDPMEIFGILLVLLVRTVAPLEGVDAYMLAALVAVATGLAGDALQDFKAGHLLGTNPVAQIVMESIGGVVGAFAAVGTLYALRETYGAMGPGTALVAPQAFAVKSVVEGMLSAPAFAVGLGAGILCTIAGLPAMTVGIGIYLPPFITSIVAVGGLCRWVVDRWCPSRRDGGSLVASGFLGGEGIVGVSLALLQWWTRS